MLNSRPDGIMAWLSVRSIDVDLPIYHGTSDAVLEHGVGHLQGTSLLVAGVHTHSVSTAHMGSAEATLFNKLRDVEIGSLLIQADRDTFTLVTCTPLGINTRRYLVTGGADYAEATSDPAAG